MSVTAGDELPLTGAVARAYFKTLAYKDEYEVARLYAETPFVGELRNSIRGFSKLRFHLAPPFFPSGTDARGRPRKKEFGAWVLPLFHLLAKLKRLRATPFDVFGYTRERKMERALIGEFEFTIDSLLPSVSAESVAEAARIIELFMEVRGFGPVKEANAERIRERIHAELRDFLGTRRRAA